MKKLKINEDVHKQMEEAYKLVEKANDKIFEIYVEDVLYTGQWWFGLLLSIVPWVLWLIFRDKESTWRLLTAGLFVMLISSWLDIVGVTLDLWHYHSEIVPIIPAFGPWDSTLMPVTIMFFLQVKPNFSPLLKAIIFGIIAAFLAEPFFIWLGLYEP